MLNKVLTALIMVVTVTISPGAAKVKKETDLIDVAQEVKVLTTIIDQLQETITQIMVRIQQNTKINKVVLSIIKDNKEIYRKDRNNFEKVVKSCDEMIKINGETLYKCKIKFQDE